MASAGVPIAAPPREDAVRVAIGVASEDNTRLVRELLTEPELWSLPELVSAEEPAPDLVIVDSATFREYRETLRCWRARMDPVVLPVLLLADIRSNEARSLTNALGEDVDDILRTPCVGEEVRARIDNLLRLRSLSQRQQAQLTDTTESLNGANRALETLHAANSVLVRAESEQSLLEAICQIVVEQEEYALAWVGFVHTGDDPLIQPAAVAGECRDAVAGLQLPYSRYEKAPSWRAIERGQAMVAPDVQATPSVYHERLTAQRIASAIALPIRPRGAAGGGVLVICSHRVDDFHDEESRLLERLAGNLEYGINALRLHHERDRKQATIEKLAYSDTVTCLPNRHHLLQCLDDLLNASVAPRRLAVFFIDLDEFKLINDGIGHLTGDAVLRELGDRLEQTVRSGDLVARHGGDEFIVVMVDGPRTPKWREVANNYDGFLQVAHATGNRLVDVLSAPLMVGGSAYRVGASVGFAIYPEHGSGATELINAADTAMYAVKNSHETVCAYSEDLL